MEAEHNGRGDRGQRGETLIESLVALTILSMIVAASFGGLQVAIRASAQHMESATAETLLRTAAERLQDPDSPYIERAGCAGETTYTGLPIRAGYGPIKVSVQFWVPPNLGESAGVSARFAQEQSSGDCPAVDPGLQRIELTLSTPSGHTERLDLMKRRT
ncbi:MAG: type II secretion system GspH family protein [Microthrixaceae bacterium]|nr:type II secretion system GspH family protein [Microthrixaceae bacterium]